MREDFIHGIPTMKSHIRAIQKMNEEIVSSTSMKVSNDDLRKCSLCRENFVHKDNGVYCSECLYDGVPEGIQ